MTRLVFGLVLLAHASALNTSNDVQSASTRRAFVGRVPFVAIVAGVTTAAELAGREGRSSAHGALCRCGHCWAPPTANAYERRDVGGPDASPITKAMNDQAYETNNRLERSGVKLETSAEQSSALTAELSKYAYSPSSNASSKDKKSNTKRTSSNNN